MSEKKRKLQLPVPESILIQIGEIAVSFASLEMGIEMLIGCLINQPQRIGQIVTAELSYKNLLNLLSSLYHERFGEDERYKTLKSLIKRADKLGDKRNQIMHSVWGAGKTLNSVTRIKITAKIRGIRYDSNEMDSAAFKQIADDMNELTLEYHDFLFALMKLGDNGDTK